jgi:SAM-dependent methyltransferase
MPSVPSEESIRREFAGQARAMSEGATFNAAGAIEPFLRLLGEPLPSRVLDLACGPGILTAALAQRGARVAALDLTPEMVERARERCRSVGITGGDFYTSSAERLPFDDGELPAAVTRLSIHHFVEPGQVLRELRRALAEGGVLVVGDIVGSADPADARLHDAIETLRDPTHQRLLPPDELRATITSCGFEIQDEERWANPKAFDEWAAVVSDVRSVEPLRAILEDLVRSGRDPGIQLRQEGGELRFTHHWRFLRCLAAPPG